LSLEGQQNECAASGPIISPPAPDARLLRAAFLALQFLASDDLVVDRVGRSMNRADRAWAKALFSKLLRTGRRVL
jgi:hypothetical protein